MWSEEAELEHSEASVGRPHLSWGRSKRKERRGKLTGPGHTCPVIFAQPLWASTWGLSYPLQQGNSP